MDALGNFDRKPCNKANYDKACQIDDAHIVSAGVVRPIINGKRTASVDSDRILKALGTDFAARTRASQSKQSRI